MAVLTKIPDRWGNHTGAQESSKLTRKRIERTLKSDRSPIVQNGDIEVDVYLQGSYRNYTNTHGSSDVDIVVKLTSAWRRGLSKLDEEARERYHSDNSEASYAYTDGFPKAVLEALRLQYRQSRFKDPVSYDDKAIEISGKHNPLPMPADVIPAMEFRTYHTYPEYGEPEFTSGMCFQPKHSSRWWVNYPKEHYSNGGDKHDNYRETVRIFKNARDYYDENYILGSDAPSYYIECLLFNVPDSILKRTNVSQRFKDTLDYLQDDSTDFSTFDQVSKMDPLFGNGKTQWDTSSANKYLKKMRRLWEDR